MNLDWDYVLGLAFLFPRFAGPNGWWVVGHGSRRRREKSQATGDRHRRTFFPPPPAWELVLFLLADFLPSTDFFPPHNRPSSHSLRSCSPKFITNRSTSIAEMASISFEPTLEKAGHNTATEFPTEVDMAAAPFGITVSNFLGLNLYKHTDFYIVYVHHFDH